MKRIDRNDSGISVIVDVKTGINDRVDKSVEYVISAYVNKIAELLKDRNLNNYGKFLERMDKIYMEDMMDEIPYDYEDLEGVN